MISSENRQSDTALELTDTAGISQIATAVGAPDLILPWLGPLLRRG